MVPLIERLSDDSEPYVRESVVEALGKIKDGRAITPILGYINSGGPKISTSKKTAMEALARLKAADSLPDVLRAFVGVPGEFTFEFAFEEMEHLIQVSSANALHAALSVDGVSSSDKGKCAMALAQLGDTRAMQPLSEILKSGDYITKNEAAKSLGKLGDQSAIALLVRLLCDDGPCPSREVSLQVLRTCFGWTPRTPKEAVWTVISEPKKDYSDGFHEVVSDKWACDAADKLRVWGVNAIDELLVASTNPELFHSELVCLIKVLGCLGDSRAIPLLRGFAETGDDMKTAYFATQALIKIGGPDVIPILESLAVTQRTVQDSGYSYDRQSDMDFVKKYTADNSQQRALASEGLTSLRGVKK